jgi:hypothetical protein
MSAATTRLGEGSDSRMVARPTDKYGHARQQPTPSAEIERQLADPFDYAFEDELIGWWETTSGTAPTPAGGIQSRSVRTGGRAHSSLTTRRTGPDQYGTGPDGPRPGSASPATAATTSRPRRTC